MTVRLYAVPVCGRRALLAVVVAWAMMPGVWAGSFEDFFAAIKRNQLSPLLGLLLRGFDVNTLDDKGQHGLHVALRADALEVASYLATLTGVKVDSLTPQGESPLMIALLRGHFDLAQALVKHGADVNKPGWTPLHYAATHTGPHALAQVAFLLENHAYIDAESPNGTTPLMMAAQYGEPEVLRLLLKEGADARMANEQKLTAIDFAQRGSRPTSVEILRTHLKALPTQGKW